MLQILGFLPFLQVAEFNELIRKTHSYGISLGYSNLELMQKILKFNTDFEKAPQQFWWQWKLQIKTSRVVLSNITGSYDTSSMKLSSPNLDDETSSDKINQNGKNTFHSLSYREKFGRYTLNLGSSYTFNQNILHFSNVDQNGSSPFNNDIDSKGNYLMPKH